LITDEVTGVGCEIMEVAKIGYRMVMRLEVVQLRSAETTVRVITSGAWVPPTKEHAHEVGNSE
jgi:hypothetical protein